jgi:hypothetical protein
MLSEQSISLLDRYVEGRYGGGSYMTLAISSCVYAVCRSNKKSVALLDISVHHNHSSDILQH